MIAFVIVSAARTAFSAATSSYPMSHPVPPTTIKIKRLSQGRVDPVDFRLYTKRVLPNEWIISGWPGEALKAGAEAIKMYAWYHIDQGGHPAARPDADICDTASCQVYNETEYANLSSSDKQAVEAAVDNTWNLAMLKDGVRFLPEYWNGRVRVYRTDGVNLRIRSAPGLNASIITSVPEGTQLKVISSNFTEADGFKWWEIADWENRNHGYAAGFFLQAMDVSGQPSLDASGMAGRLTQYGTEYWARQGMGFQGILRKFYGNNVQFVTPTIGAAVPTVTASLTIVPPPPYLVGQLLTARFTITNKGTVPITFRELVAGGRLNDVHDCSNTGGVCSDFTKVFNLTLNPGASYSYQGTFTPAQPGSYEFQVFYMLPDGTWHWFLPTEPGVSNLVRITVATPPTTAIATITVTKTADTNDGVCDADCSLREAITTASTGAKVAIPAGTYTLTLGFQLTINKNLTLAGTGATTTIIQAATGSGVADFRVFNITGGNVAIFGVTIRHGRLTAKEEQGAGIRNDATLALVDSFVQDNSVNGSASRGGGIYNTGTLTIRNSDISSNSAFAGGGVYNYGGTLEVNTTTINSNRALDGGGGVINFRGTVDIIYSKITNNVSSCAPYSCAGPGGIGNMEGPLRLINSTVIGNLHDSPDFAGGGVSTRDGTVTIIDTTVSNNRSTGYGGGGIVTSTFFGVAKVLTLINTTVSGNLTAGHGGGIYHGADSDTLVLMNTTVSGNRAEGNGGGIYNYAHAGGNPLKISFSTISANSARGDGGGIYNDWVSPILASSLLALNSTDSSGPDCAGSIVSIGYNLVGNNSGCSFSPATGDLAGC
jgi:CSLREA domain-containing protein